jgi:metallo-beta-lactamase class B
MGDKGFGFYAKAFGKLTLKAKEPPTPPAKDSKEGKAADKLPARPDPAPPVCYDLKQLNRAPVQNAKPIEPFEILDGLYYVGNTQVSAHLLKTSDGLILIDSTMPHQIPWLLESIRKLGFQPGDVKVVIGTHAAIDHTGGHWYFQRHFAARTWMHAADAPGVMSAKCEAGAKVDLTLVKAFEAYPPFKPDRLIKDAEVVEWGGRTLMFHHTPTSTPGTMSLEIPLHDNSGKIVRAGLFGGCAPRESGFANSIKRLKERDIQIWLAVHPDQNKTLEKAAKLKDGKGANPFFDPDGWNSLLDKMMSRDRKAKPDGF